jgi:radical SAM-linked protein
MTAELPERYRLRFHKTQDLRYIGHLDLHRSLERTLRRANLPLDYSKGFNPRIKLNLSTALPLGCTSTTELADFWLVEDREEDEVLKALHHAVPPGLSFISLNKIDPGLPSLQSQITAVTYHVELTAEADSDNLQTRLDNLLASPSLIRTRRGKSYDLRPLIRKLEIVRRSPAGHGLQMVLSAREAKTGRPEEVLLALGIDPAECQIERTQLFLEG